MIGTILSSSHESEEGLSSWKKMKTRRMTKRMTTRTRTRSQTSKSSTKRSPSSSTRLSASRVKTPQSFPELENVSQPLPPLENTSTNLNQNQSQNPSQSQSQSLPKTTSGLDVSAGAQRKLTADEVKFAKLNIDLKENIGSIGGLLVVIGRARGNAVLEADGMVILQHNEKLSNDLTQLAEKYDYVYNCLSYMVQATVWGAVISDVAIIALSIAGN